MFFSIFFAFSVVVAQEPSACSWADLEASCGSVRQHIKKLIDKGAKLKPKTFEEKKPALEKTFSKVKSAMLEMLLDGRDRSQLSATEEAMYIKVSTIRMISPSQGSGYSCEGKSELNGRYFHDMHAFTICPGAEFLPESAYFASMAHEIAHSIDPCISQFGLVRLKINNLHEAKQSGRFDDFIENEIDEWKQDLPEYEHRVRGGHPRTAFAWRGIHSAKTIEGLKSVGLLEDLAPAIPFQEYPFGKAISCLKEAGITSVNAKLPSIDDDKNVVYPHCQGKVLGAMSQVPESLCDVIAGKVLGKLLKDNPPKGVDRPMTFWLLLQKKCLSNEPEKTNLTVYAPKESRIDKLLLANKDLREVFQCPPSKHRDCSESLRARDRNKPSGQFVPQVFGGPAVEK